MSSPSKTKKMHCGGCHGCKINKCFGCCDCVASENCPGCCTCSGPPPTGFRPGLPASEAYSRGWTLTMNDVWTRKLTWEPKDPLDVRTWNYGIGAPRLELFFQCPCTDVGVQTVCRKMCSELAAHRASVGCDCDWASIRKCAPETGLIYRVTFDGIDSPRLSPRRLPEDIRAVCDDPTDIIPYMTRYMEYHDKHCECGCFGRPGEGVQSGQSVQSEHFVDCEENENPEQIVNSVDMRSKLDVDAKEAEQTEHNVEEEHTLLPGCSNKAKGKEVESPISDNSFFDERAWPSRFDRPELPHHDQPPSNEFCPPTRHHYPAVPNGGAQLPSAVNSSFYHNHEHQRLWDQPYTEPAPPEIMPMLREVRDMTYQAIELLLPHARNVAAQGAAVVVPVARQVVEQGAAIVSARLHGPPSPPSAPMVPEEDIEEGWLDAEDEF